MARFIFLVLALLCTAPSFAQPSAPAARAEALQALNAPDPALRADAVIWLANNGSVPDDKLLQRYLVDDNPVVRELAEQGMWVLWTRSGDKAIDALMTRGAEETRALQYREAVATYSEVIRRKPAFAEGWNKRATVLFLMGDYKKSIADCDEVIKRNAIHFGALAGYGQIYFQQKQYTKAIEYWQRALKANPNMRSVAVNIEIAEKLREEQRKNTV